MAAPTVGRPPPDPDPGDQNGTATPAPRPASTGELDYVPTLQARLPDDLPRRVTIALWAALVLATGYLAFGRPWSQLGNAGVNLFLGELILGAFLLWRPTREALLGIAHNLFRPCRTHVLWWSLAALLTYGLIQFAAAVVRGPQPLEAAKIFAANYLPFFLVGGIAAQAMWHGFLPWLNRWLPWVNGIVIVVSQVVFKNQLNLPFSHAKGIAPQSGTIVVFALLLAYERPLFRRWYLWGLNGFALLLMQIRAQWLAVFIAGVIWAVLSGHIRTLLKVALAGTVLLGALAIADVKIPGSPARGGEVSIAGILARSIAPFDPDLSAQIATPTGAGSFKDTADWRRKWWRIIRYEQRQTVERRLFGLGYGQPLSEYAPFIPYEERPVRTPHNLYYFALGYGGYVGVAVLYGFLGALGRTMLWVYRRTRNPLGLLVWSMALGQSLFDNFYETPFAAVPIYFVLGACLVPAVPELVAVIRGALRLGPAPPNLLSTPPPA